MSLTNNREHARRLGISMMLAGIVLAAITPAQAASHSQKPTPIQIHSNNADFNQNSGKSTYTGDVRMTRAGLTLTGNKLVVTQPKSRNHIKAVLTGKPAHINKQPDASGDKVVTGHAQRIEYTNGNSTITLSGNAVVTRNGDQINASVITYNIDTGATHAKSGSSNNSRVHITISPQNHGHSQ